MTSILEAALTRGRALEVCEACKEKAGEVACAEHRSKSGSSLRLTYQAMARIEAHCCATCGRHVGPPQDERLPECPQCDGGDE